MHPRKVRILALLLTLFFGVITILGTDMVSGRLVTDGFLRPDTLQDDLTLPG
jgi:hypothetical protein